MAPKLFNRAVMSSEAEYLPGPEPRESRRRVPGSPDRDCPGRSPLKRTAIAVLCLTLAAMAAPASRAQLPPQWCHADGATAEQVIQACSPLIFAVQTPPVDRAAAFHRRGLAYARRGEHERAIADFDQALRINPREASYFNARGLS